MRDLFYTLIEYLEKNEETFHYDGTFDFDALIIEIKAYAASVERQIQ